VSHEGDPRYQQIVQAVDFAAIVARDNLIGPAQTYDDLFRDRRALIALVREARELLKFGNRLDQDWDLKRYAFLALTKEQP
jgi:hypothetical protein